MENLSSSRSGPPTADLFNDLGKEYEEAYGHNADQTRIGRQFIDLLPADGSVLDCGSGTGKPMSYMIAESGRRLHGIDMAEKMVALSSKQVPKGTFEVADMLHYAPADKFDGVVASLSLFQLPREEITAMSHKWFQWLRPGGHLFIVTFGAEDCGVKEYMYDSDGQCARQIEWTFMGRQILFTTFTKAGWNKLLETAGFEIVHTETDIFSPPAEALCDDEPQFFIIAQKPTDTPDSHSNTHE